MPDDPATEKTRVVLWGATGHAKVLRESLGRLGYQIVALFDNNPELTSPWTDVPLYHGEPGFCQWRRAVPDPGIWCLGAIGGHRGRDRLAIQDLFVAAGLRPLTWVDDRAVVADNAKLGPGSQVLMGACVGAEARIGAATIVNTRASVDHECELGPGVHVAPGVVLCGLVRVGAGTMIAAGAVVLPRVTIGADTIVGAGAVVTRDLPDGVVAFGNPARVRRRVDS